MKTKLAIQPLIIDIETATAVLSLSKSTIEALERNGDFVKRRKISAKRTGFLMRELEEWAESRPVSDLLPPPNTARNAAA